MKGCVWSIKSKVEVKGIPGLSRFLQKLEGKINVRDSGIEIGFRDIPMFSVKSESGVAFEKVAGAAEMSPVALETKVSGLLFEMPLPGHGGEVTGFLKDFSRSDSVSKGDIACCNTVLSGEKGDPRRMAFGGVVKLREAESVSCEAVKVWCFDFPTIATDIRESEVIDHDDDNIGAL